MSKKKLQTPYSQDVSITLLQIKFGIHKFYKKVKVILYVVCYLPKSICIRSWTGSMR